MNRKKIAVELLDIAEKILSAKEKKPFTELEQKVMDFLNKNPNPPDADFHKWAEGQKLVVDEAEAAAYKLATLFVEFWKDGRSNEKGYKESEADPKELKMGIEVEKEHSPNVLVTKRISLDHLAEVPEAKIKYYTALKWAEKLIEKSAKMTDEEVKDMLEKIKKLIGE